MACIFVNVNRSVGTINPNIYGQFSEHLGRCIYQGIYVGQASDIPNTNGGSEALQIAFNCILDDGDEILIPEPFYPNYNTMVCTCGASIHPIPTSPHEGYRYADRARIEAEINEHTRAIVCTNPGNPTGVVLTDDEMNKKSTCGTVSYMPAVFGCYLAEYVIKRL